MVNFSWPQEQDAMRIIDPSRVGQHGRGETTPFNERSSGRWRMLGLEARQYIVLTSARLTDVGDAPGRGQAWLACGSITGFVPKARAHAATSQASWRLS